MGDLSETAVLLTAAHELTHFIQEYSLAQYEQLRDFVVERLTESQDTDLDTLVERHRRAQPGLSYDQALDEVVADGCQMMLKDSQAAAQLAKKNRSLAGNIRSWLRKWVKRLQEAMRGLTARSREARAMELWNSDTGVYEDSELPLPSGVDGVTPHIGDNGNWYLGDEDTGVAAKGDAPVKGTDYWTAADKAEIVADVLAALPDGTEVSY